MLTMRQTERWWNAKSYSRLLDELCEGRAEGVSGIRDLLDGPPDRLALAAAAMTVIRATELRQESHPLVGKLITLLLATQNTAGGWGDEPNSVAITALAARGLAQTGTGRAVDAALNYLADAQNADGEWSANDSTNNSASDADGSESTLTDMAMTAFVLYQLATIRRPVAALIIDGALTQMLSDGAHDRQVDTQLNTLRRRIEARRVLAAA